MRVRHKPRFNFKGTVNGYEKIAAQKEALMTKIAAAGYTPTIGDQLQFQTLSDQESKLDSKVAKLSSKYEQFAQLSKARLDKLQQTIEQGLHGQHVGLFTIIGAATVGAGLAVLRRQHNFLYGDVVRAQPSRRSDEAYVARQVNAAIRHGLIS